MKTHFLSDFEPPTDSSPLRSIFSSILLLLLFLYLILMIIRRAIADQLKFSESVLPKDFSKSKNSSLDFGQLRYLAAEHLRWVSISPKLST